MRQRLRLQYPGTIYVMMKSECVGEVAEAITGITFSGMTATGSFSCPSLRGKENAEGRSGGAEDIAWLVVRRAGRGHYGSHWRESGEEPGRVSAAAVSKVRTDTCTATETRTQHRHSLAGGEFNRVLLLGRIREMLLPLAAHRPDLLNRALAKVTLMTAITAIR